MLFIRWLFIHMQIFPTMNIIPTSTKVTNRILPNIVHVSEYILLILNGVKRNSVATIRVSEWDHDGFSTQLWEEEPWGSRSVNRYKDLRRARLPSREFAIGRLDIQRKSRRREWPNLCYCANWQLPLREPRCGEPFSVTFSILQKSALITETSTFTKTQQK